MHVDLPRAGANAGDLHGDVDTTQRRRESECTLNSIACALIMGVLPPDDAFAWARIAAVEVRGRRLSSPGAPPRP